MGTQLDCYGILQVHPKAEKEVIEAAYRRLASKYHPDVSHVSDALERMKQINTAYEVLSDPIKRAAYDAARGLVPPTDAPPHAAARPRYLTNAWRTRTDSGRFNASCCRGVQIRPLTSVVSSQTCGVTCGHFSGCLAPIYSGETKGMNKGPGKVWSLKGCLRKSSR